MCGAYTRPIAGTHRRGSLSLSAMTPPGRYLTKPRHSGELAKRRELVFLCPGITKNRRRAPLETDATRLSFRGRIISYKRELPAMNSSYLPSCHRVYNSWLPQLPGRIPSMTAAAMLEPPPAYPSSIPRIKSQRVLATTYHVKVARAAIIKTLVPRTCWNIPPSHSI